MLRVLAIGPLQRPLVAGGTIRASSSPLRNHIRAATYVDVPEISTNLNSGCKVLVSHGAIVHLANCLLIRTQEAKGVRFVVE
jgi:hypothetical protein